MSQSTRKPQTICTQKLHNRLQTEQRQPQIHSRGARTPDPTTLPSLVSSRPDVSPAFAREYDVNRQPPIQRKRKPETFTGSQKSPGTYPAGWSTARTGNNHAEIFRDVGVAEGKLKLNPDSQPIKVHITTRDLESCEEINKVHAATSTAGSRENNGAVLIECSPTPTSAECGSYADPPNLANPVQTLAQARVGSSVYGLSTERPTPFDHFTQYYRRDMAYYILDQEIQSVRRKANKCRGEFLRLSCLCYPNVNTKLKIARSALHSIEFQVALRNQKLARLQDQIGSLESLFD